MLKHFNKNILFSLFIAAVAIVSMPSCVDESFSTDPSLKLTFSTDTLLFDTVFTTVGSATRRIMVYNPNRKNVEISSIRLGMGENSYYRLNVDGNVNTRNAFQNIEIRAKDSLYIFVEVTVDPQKTDAPTFVKDSIVFNTNSNLQDVKLIAYGQNMEVLRNRTIKNDTTLTDKKPYLIYGNLVVDSAKTLTLKPGCRLYFHAQSNLVVRGSLIADGSRDKPILMRGDRPDRIFTDLPYNYVSNQWGSVLLIGSESHHKLNFVEMNSGYAGIYFVNENRQKTPTLEVTNCRIHNFLKYGLVVKNGDVAVGNTEISNTGSYSVYLNGGKHTFTHTTIANYFQGFIQPSAREQNAACMIMELNKVQPMETVFENCIIAGNSTNEFALMTRFPAEYHGTFKNSYIRNKNPETVFSQFTDVRWYEKPDTVFKNMSFDVDKKLYYNFMPDSVSPARNIGSIEIAKKFPFDRNGKNRLGDNAPDAGAYEWQPTKK